MKGDSLDALVGAYSEETAYRERDAGALRAGILAKARVRKRDLRPFAGVCAAGVILAGGAAFAATGSAGRAGARLVEWLRPAASEADAVQRPRVIQASRRAREHAAIEHLAAGTANIAVQPSAVSDGREAAIPLSALPTDGELVRHGGSPVASHSRAERDAAVAATTRSSETGPVRAENAPGAEPGAVGAETATGNLEATGSSADLSAELALYQSAHSLHFGGGTPASALQGWRRYLAEYPRGTLSAEARLNEAVCLVKLGKRTEARRLLESLSAGNPRSIERQAGELLGALGVVPSK